MLLADPLPVRPFQSDGAVLRLRDHRVDPGRGDLFRQGRGLYRRADARSPAIAWHLDQIALDVAHLVSDDIALSDLPLGAMLIAAPDADIPDDAYFWAVNYSITANARKLAHPIFKKLERASLIVVIPVFDDSPGLQRTVESVARAGYSNVAHVVIDHRRADRQLNPEEGGNAGSAISASGKAMVVSPIC